MWVKSTRSATQSPLTRLASFPLEFPFAHADKYHSVEIPSKRSLHRGGVWVLSANLAMEGRE